MRTFIYCVILLIASVNDIYSQQQVKKGKWMLTHTLGGFYLETEKTKSYDENVLDDHYKNSESGFGLVLNSPTYASIRAYKEKYENIPADDNGSKENDFGIYLNPEIGYFVKDGLLIGTEVVLGYYTSKQRVNDRNSTYHSHGIDLGIGPFVRYYFKPKNKRSPFVGLNTSVGTTLGRREGHYFSDPDEYLGKDKENYTHFTINPSTGYAWFLGKHWSIYLQLEYSYFKSKRKLTSWQYENDVLLPDYPSHRRDENSLNNISLNGGLTFTF